MIKLQTQKLPARKTGGFRKAAPPQRHELKAQNLFSESDDQQILEEVHELFDGTYTVVRPGPWKRAFRPSGFPYCPVIDAMSGPENMDYGKAFYLDIGTTVHELMQEYISRSSRGKRIVYANWKCKDCDGLHEFQQLPYICAFCGADSERLHYEELEFHDALGIQGGHIDLLIKTSKGWIVCDWKTASTRGLDYRNESDGKHHHQLQSYCLAVQTLFKEHLQGLPVIGYMLIFVPRDASGNGRHPDQTSNWTPYLYLWNSNVADATRKRLFFSRASYEAASIGYETGNWLPAAWMRPCRSLVDFSKPMGMQDAFYGGKLCPNLDVCCRSSEEVADAISKRRAEIAVESAAIKKRVEDSHALYLQLASQGYIAPQLLAEIEAAANNDDYDFDKHDGLIALRESLERHIDMREQLQLAAAFAKPDDSPLKRVGVRLDARKVPVKPLKAPKTGGFKGKAKK